MKLEEIDEKVSAACIIAIFLGILLPKIISKSLENTLLVWLIAAVIMGLVLTNKRHARTLRFRSFWPALALNLSWFGYIFVRAAVDILKGEQAFKISMQSKDVDVFSDIFLLIIFAFLAGFAFLGTWLSVLLSAKGSYPISRMLSNLYNFGPDGIERVNKILITITVTIGALFALWAAFHA